MTTLNNAVNGNASDNNNVIVFANFYVQLVNGEKTMNINTVKGAYNPDNKAHAKCLEIIKTNPERLLSRPTLSTGEKLYEVDEANAFDERDWS